jgi:hypothetical protein
MKLSLTEIYCERINDLLDPSRANLQVGRQCSAQPAEASPQLASLQRMHPPPPALQMVADTEAGTAVADVTWMPVSSEQECIDIMRLGLANRAVSATSMNATSSRCRMLARGE